MRERTPSILLIEDHATLGRILARFLRERGNMAIWALVETAEAALERLAARPANGGPPDLILIDASLPEMSGIDLVAELARRYPELPCLMLSAHSDPKYVRQALDNGARGYVAKGDPPVVVEAVGQVLNGEIYLSDVMRQAMDA
ncbi:MAG: response regulator transcription factor [Candidatus Promineifilaceae bacterium]|nr:response regulator transcription factor [Candidatus Promineifilaceae bacterium]